MQHFFHGPLPDHARNIMRHLGYGEQRAKSGQISYVRRVASDRFPRFHAYVEDKNSGIQVNLHMDQKEASYEGSHVHSGEYESQLCQEEMNRIIQFIQTPNTVSTQTQVLRQRKKTNFLSRFFK
ncbi:hypothetical protein HYV69_02035 [Candidatus Uhrbacteria bacterium]|nr:hypothetical protein [Candidatus Uhrbacteria bacterium]